MKVEAVIRVLWDVPSYQKDLARIAVERRDTISFAQYMADGLKGDPDMTVFLSRVKILK
jgi:hypothetical protein